MPPKQASLRHLSLRPVDSADHPFLFELYLDSRLDEVSSFGWNEAQQIAFLNMQFTARQSAYRLQFPTAEDRVILWGNENAGRLITDRSTGDIVIVDMAVALKFRRLGVGSQIIKRLQAEAFGTGVKVILRVNKENLPAFELYCKLGFVTASENQILYSMSWDGYDTTEVGESE